MYRASRVEPDAVPGEQGPEWRPAAALEVLRLRARALAAIRAFFAERGVLEVETPLLAQAATTAPHLHSLAVRYTGPGAAHGRRLYLQTSPEYAMKRLLAAGSGPIYQIAKAFRDGESGRLHNPEFTLLEWYRPGLDCRALMDEVEALLRRVLGGAAGAARATYAELFRAHLGIDPHAAALAELRECAVRLGIGGDGLALAERDGWLDLLFSHCIEPLLGRGGPQFVCDYPASQAALAQIRPGPVPVAERFEVYVGGVELANGYQELTDAAEQRARFERDRARRRAAGDTDLAPDERLLAALEHGLPPGSGVALGVDRLIMLAAGAASLDEVLAFPVARA